MHAFGGKAYQPRHTKILQASPRRTLLPCTACVRRYRVLMKLICQQKVARRATAAWRRACEPDRLIFFFYLLAISETLEGEEEKSKKRLISIIITPATNCRVDAQKKRRPVLKKRFAKVGRYLKKGVAKWGRSRSRRKKDVTAFIIRALRGSQKVLAVRRLS